MERFLVLSLLFFSFNSFANVPMPSETSHPGNDKILISFQRTDVSYLGRTSALYIPERLDGTKAPLVVFGHGQAIGESSYDRTLEHLAGKGVAALFVKYDNGFFDQNWRRMASDWNEITAQVIDNYDAIDANKVIYSGHSKGGYVGLMAAGAKNQPGVGSVIVFAPAGFDEDYLKALDPKTVVTIVWGEQDTIIDKSLQDDIYNGLQVDKKQFIEVKSYTDREADHYFPMNRGSIFGGQDGVSGFHFHGVWKWLVAAAWDLEDGAPVAQPYVYGDLTDTSGDPNVIHKITRNWTTRYDYLVKVKGQTTGMLNALIPFWKDLKNSWYKAYLPETLANGLSQRADVEYIGRNHKLKPLVEPNDLNRRQWAFQNPLGFDVSASLAWDMTTGSHDVVVGVIDSGISLKHRDMRDNLWVNETELNGEDNVDDDNNGYVDDVYGYNFATKQASPNDSRGHGTMVSGMIGAVGNNNYGITGMAWNVSLMALNMFPNLWGDATLESALLALDYAIDNGAQVINASWGQADDDLEPDEAFKALEEAIERANQKGILFVAAAGNSKGNNDIKGMVPATLKIDNILAVGAMNRKGQAWAKTNYGKNSVHVLAPGEEVYTTHPDGFRMPSGTSLSAPIVTGVVALMLDVNPSLTPQQIKDIMIDSCDPVDSLRDMSLCGGYLNAAKAVKQAQAFKN